MKLWPRHGGDQSITMLLCAESRRMELLHTTDRVSWYKGLEIVVEVMYSLTKLGGQMRGYASGRRPPKSPTGSTSPPRSRRKPQPPAPQGPHNAYYEAGWTDSWSHRHCLHEHRTLLEAAACAAPHGAGWYVFAVEDGNPRQLKAAEDEIVNEFRFKH
jgi:hypothetical protein